MKGQKGITLVALIITIIVMLILVAVTLSIALGDNGIIGNAKEATTGMNGAAANEANIADQVQFTTSSGDAITGINNIVDAVVTAE